MSSKYVKDENGSDLLTDSENVHQIMMEWEKPYMEKSIEVLNPFGKVLEIGFGMGYSATEICKNINVTEYTVIECKPNVWNKFEEWKVNERKDLKINLIKGRWEDVLETVDKFDCIYFDDYSTEGTAPATRINNFTYNIIKYHLKIGSKFTFFCTGNYNIFENVKCLQYEYNDFNIKIPKNCKYASGDKMYIPVYTLLSDPDKDLEIKLLGDKNAILKIQEKVNKVKEYYSKPKSIYCNLLIIDNFYNNPLETRNYILTQDFKVRGNYPGQRTESFANEHLKEMIQGYIKHFAGKITQWPTENGSYNGAFQYTTSRDRTWVHNDGWNNWAGVLYMTPNAPVTAGTGIFKFRDGTRTSLETEVRGNKEIIDSHSQDYTKWELVDRVGNVFNRLVLFNSTQYHASLDYFGTCKEDGRLFQVFFFSTEK